MDSVWVVFPIFRGGGGNFGGGPMGGGPMGGYGYGGEL